ncbi:hypothetical protein [Tateyamaria sp.]|uniref:hypothetical protein n=1 Tax=Tateyamaria sp. TaxID=1929288 RepID=UPI003B20F9DD
MNSPIDTALRMAKVSPLYSEAVLYGTAEESGAAVFDAAGEMQFDRMGQTYGYADKSKETVFTASQTYEGSHLVTVISDYAPNGLALILLGDVFYVVHSVHSSDVLGVSLTLDCTSLPADEPPNIRNA